MVGIRGLKGYETIDMAGKSFGSWTVIGRCPKKRGYGGAYWICKCLCGQTKSALGGNLRRGTIGACKTCVNTPKWWHKKKALGWDRE